jgi:vacuolar-type H+-ATPase subunit I/STV1
MQDYESMPYRPILAVDDMSRLMYQYNNEKNKNHIDSYQIPNKNTHSLNSLVKEDERIVADEIENIEHQIAEREKIKQRNIKFLEEQRQKLEDFMNRTECFTYRASGMINAVRNKLTTQLVQVELKKGEEYVNAFRDMQRLEAEKRRLLAEERADEGWLG